MLATPTSGSRLSWETHVNLHLFVQAVVHNQAVRHSYSVGLHGVPSDIGIVSGESVGQ